MYWLLTRGRFPYLALLLMVTGAMAYFAQRDQRVLIPLVHLAHSSDTEMVHPEI